MQNMEELYSLEQPIRVELGNIYPFLVEEYGLLAQFYGTLDLDKVSLMHHFNALAKEDEQLYSLVQALDALGLLQFVQSCGDTAYKGSFLYDLYCGYRELFAYCFRQDVFDLIQNEEQFEHYMGIIRDLNGFEYEPTSINPEVERRNQLRKKMESMKGDGIGFKDMFTSVCVGLHKLPSEVNKLTIYNFRNLFSRIGQFKNYDTSVLFATVSSEAEIEAWYSPTEVEKNESYITSEQLNKAREGKGLQSDL